MTDDELQRTATHESAHAAMGFLVGHRIDAVSIVPSAHYGGVTLASYGAVPASYTRRDVTRRRPLESAAFAPAPFRRWVAGRVLMSLAGPAADRWLGEPDLTSRYVETEPDEIEAERLSALVVLSSHEAQRLEESVPLRADDDAARETALVVFGDEAVGAYLGWLKAESVRIVTSARFRVLLGALVPVLLEHSRMSGAAVRRVLKAADDY